MLPERKRAQPIAFPPKKFEECKTIDDIKIEKDCDKDMRNIESVFKQE